MESFPEVPVPLWLSKILRRLRDEYYAALGEIPPGYFIWILPQKPFPYPEYHRWTFKAWVELYYNGVGYRFLREPGGEFADFDSGLAYLGMLSLGHPVGVNKKVIDALRQTIQRTEQELEHRRDTASARA